MKVHFALPQLPPLQGREAGLCIPVCIKVHWFGTRSLPKRTALEGGAEPEGGCSGLGAVPASAENINSARWEKPASPAEMVENTNPVPQTCPGCGFPVPDCSIPSPLWVQKWGFLSHISTALPIRFQKRVRTVPAAVRRCPLTVWFAVSSLMSTSHPQAQSLLEWAEGLETLARCLSRASPVQSPCLCPVSRARHSAATGKQSLGEDHCPEPTEGLFQSCSDTITSGGWRR